MPIYEFACPKCRRIFSFLSRRLNPEQDPKCPKCGSKKLIKEMSGFAMIKGATEAPSFDPSASETETPMPDFEDPKVMGLMSEMERDMDHLDDKNPKHLAHLMRKFKEIMPAGGTPKELEVAIKRLEAGEDPEKIEADMGDVLEGWMGADDPSHPNKKRGTNYTRDSGLYDY